MADYATRSAFLPFRQSASTHVRSLSVPTVLSKSINMTSFRVRRLAGEIFRCLVLPKCCVVVGPSLPSRSRSKHVIALRLGQSTDSAFSFFIGAGNCLGTDNLPACYSLRGVLIDALDGKLSLHTILPSVSRYRLDRWMGGREDLVERLI